METAPVVQEEEQHHELAPQLRFPPGYRFVPTELELLGYLRDKIEGHEQPLAAVNEVAILDWQPGSLVEAYKGYGESKWYFFTIREPSSSNKEEEPNRKVRVPGVKATWKATGSVAPIAAAGASSKQQGEGGREPAAADEVVVGTKRVLIYQSSDAEEDGKWSMHEYILKGHAKIGQYALCSIQRKQHSDTVDDAGEGTSSSPKKTKRRRTKKKLPTQPEGLQLQQLQETASVETPLKPKSSEGKQDQEVVASFNPAKAPLTPPQQAPPQALQQSAPLLPASPLQGYTSSLTDEMLGASAPIPMHEEEEGRHVNSFQYDDGMTLSYLDVDAFMKSCYPMEQPQNSFDQQCYEQDEHNMLGALYRELRRFPGNITQDNSSSWNNHGGAFGAPDQQLLNYEQENIGGAFGAPDQQLLNYEQENIGGAFGAPDQPHTGAQYHDQSPDQFMGSVDGDGAASGSDGGMGLTEAELFAMAVLRDDDPLDCLGGAHGGSDNPEAFQTTQDEPLRSSCGQQQQQQQVAPPPSRSISEFWER